MTDVIEVFVQEEIEDSFEGGADAATFAGTAAIVEAETSGLISEEAAKFMVNRADEIMKLAFAAIAEGRATVGG